MHSVESMFGILTENNSLRRRMCALFSPEFLQTGAIFCFVFCFVCLFVCF